MMPSSSSCASHSRFLRTLVEREEQRARNPEPRPVNIDPVLVTDYPPPYPSMPSGGSPPPAPLHPSGTTYAYPHSYPPPAHILPTNGKNGHVEVYPEPFPNSTADVLYYDNMCRELGVNRGVDLINASPSYYSRGTEQQYTMMGH